MAPWWQDAVVYQIYPRSFQDSDGDGVGDLAGIERRLDHLEWLGVDAFWLSPIYPSPLADFGYDIADHRAVDPVFGTLEGFDRLLAAAHARGIRVLLDLVPSHTSIDHPWFRRHPERYVWADGPEPPNNWVAAFGGPTWSPDPRSGRLYLHSFYPEQPDLDWRRPAVREAIADVVRFWRGRGVDGFRVDAIDRVAKDPELRDDPPARGHFPLPLPLGGEHLEPVHSRNGPGIPEALATLREAAGEALLIGEVYLPSAALPRYLDQLDLVFAFEPMHRPPDPAQLAAAIAAAAALGRVAWVLSSHDFPRLATRWGPERARLAAFLLLTLPGAAFLYQGEELGLRDGPGAEPPFDRAGRDGARHPLPWSDGAGRGFSDGTAWLPVAEGQSVDAARADPGSLAHLVRELIATRRSLRGELRLLDLGPGALAYARGESLVALNFGPDPLPLPGGETLLADSPDALAPRHRLRPGHALLLA